jgi:hypothetical protein
VRADRAIPRRPEKEPTRTRPRYCSRACFYRARRVTDAGSTPSARRIHAAHKLGVRGPLHLARAAHASTKTVYSACRALGLVIGSDVGPSAQPEVIIGDLRVVVVADEGFGPARRRPAIADVVGPVAWRGAQRLAVLHPAEWATLERLARSPGEVVTSEELRAGWVNRRALASSNRSLPVYVASLRRKLGVTITSSPGVGYRLELGAD